MKSLLLLISIFSFSFLHLQAASRHHRASTSHSTSAPQRETTPGVKVTNFGKSPSGVPVKLYTLTNKNGLSVSITNYGATTVNIWAPDRKGNFADVVLGYDSLSPYFTNTPYFGTTIGRYVNRIAKGEFTLEGKTYHLPINNGPNCIHGGKEGFNKKVWTAQIVSRHSTPAVAFSLVSPDGDQGFPGTLHTELTFMLNNENELVLLYKATSDRTTVLNLTNHSYFNLAGAGNGKILNHLIRINADRYTPSNAQLLPTGEIRSVAGTPYDLRKFTRIGDTIQKTGNKPIGYDNNFVLNKPILKKYGFAAEVVEPQSGRILQVFTDQPAIQLYTSNFLDGTLQGKKGAKYPQHGAFCLETQYFPDSVHHPNFPSTVLQPNQVYQSVTVFKFTTR